MDGMVRKVNVSELEKGMYVCGFEKEGEGKVISFVNNILVRDKKDVKKFYNYGYRTAYVLVDGHKDASTPLCPVPPCVNNGVMASLPLYKGQRNKERREDKREGKAEEKGTGRGVEIGR